MVYLIWPALTRARSLDEEAVTAPPLGLASLAAWLERAGEPVFIHDLALSGETPAQLRDALRRAAPDVVGISCPMSHLEPEVFALAPEIKRACPDATLLIGGNHATFRADEILAQCDAIDAVVLYDGEETLLDIVRTVKSGARMARVPGLIHRSDSGIEQTAPRQRIADLDRLPIPARHLLHLDQYPMEHRGQLISSRGCPFGCAFCATAAFHGRKVRHRSVSHLMGEIDDMVHRHGIEALAFVDDTFTLDRKRTLAICEAIARSYPGLSWTCESRTDVLDEELLRTMSSSGCNEILFGIESPNPKALKQVRKGVADMDRARHILQYARRVGIRVRANFILGMPGDTPAVVDQIESFVRATRPDTVHCSMLAVYPGTPMYQCPKAFGILDFSTDYTADKQFTPMVSSRDFGPREQQEAFVRLAHLLADAMVVSPAAAISIKEREGRLMRFIRSDDVEAVEYPDNLVLIDQVTGKLAKLDPLSTLVWLMSDGDRTCESIAVSLREQLPDLPVSRIVEISADLANHDFLTAVKETC